MRLSRHIDNDTDLALLNEAAQAVAQHRLFILGPEVEMLELEMAGWLDTKYAVGCNSGFGALLLSILALDLKLNAPIAVPVFAPSDSIGVLLRKHFTPVLVDINTHDLQMDVSDLSRRIDDNINAIIVHHLFGGTVDMPAILNRAGNIPVIEVLTYSLGARIDNLYTGNSRTMATADLRMTIGGGAWGDAGMIWTGNTALAEEIREIRVEKADLYTGVTSGNFHQDRLQAAFLLRKFESWKRMASKRSEQIAVFAQAMRDREASEIIIPAFYNQYGTELVILADHRDELIAYLQKRDIESSIWWPLPIHLQPGFQSLGHKRGDFPQAEWVTDRLIQLPVPVNVEEIERLVDSIVNFYGG